jgi:hypothetical protein
MTAQVRIRLKGLALFFFFPQKFKKAFSVVGLSGSPALSTA